MSTVGNDATIALWVGHAIFAVVSTILGFLAYVRNVKKEAQLAYFLVCVLTSGGWLTGAQQYDHDCAECPAYLNAPPFVRRCPQFS
jgi:hypothetical protein